MLQVNNLPTMSFPDNSASGSVLQASRLANLITPQETDKSEEKGAAEQTPVATATVHETSEADKIKPQIIKTSTQSTGNRTFKIPSKEKQVL
ncbi:hypothetical protein Hamer_G006223 [Homarus americanus]|uniref:Uncharacterized protein n=1 Tax=Homarus americanus TaxID=6706 RepID=A0A8J5MPC1_HOMAM|nr:hypothetical protein Hamer_G006223 [Homarus americanus]